MRVIKKKKRISIPKNLNIVHCWNIIGPIVAREIATSNYTPIPNCFDTNAYKIGYIFVPFRTKVTCFRATPVLKILGPLRDFAVKAKTNPKWLSKEFRSVRTSSDEVDFQIILEHGKNILSFRGYDYYFLTKAKDMLIPGNVTINRVAHEDLLSTKWIGLITDVVVTKIFEIRIIKDVRERVLYVGDNNHTILFKYEICEVDPDGTIIKSEMKKIHCKWQPIGEQPSDCLPLTIFQSGVNK